MGSKYKPKACLLGKVNAGKSSLFNALIGNNRSPVSSYAGHTKEFIVSDFFNTITLVDTPGILDVDESISKLSMNYVEKNADIIVFVINAAEGPTQELYKEYLKLKEKNITIMLVATRVDLLDSKERTILKEQCEDIFKSKLYLVSSRENIGVITLKNELLNLASKIEKLSNKTEDEIEFSDIVAGGIVSTVFLGVAGLIIKSIFKRN